MSGAPLRAWFAVPGDLAAPTGGYAYARALLRHAARHGLDLHALALPASFPNPSDADLAAATRAFAAAPAGSVLLVDGLAYGAIPAPLLAGANRRFVALVHHPLALETGLDPASSMRLAARERAALGVARHVIASSRTTGRVLSGDYGVPAARLTVAEPGTDPAPRARGSAAGTPLRLLAVGALSARKGYDVLVEALTGLGGTWRLAVVGSLDRDPATAAALYRQIEESELGARVQLLGELDAVALQDAYDRADVVVSASLYEGYGMALAEALAHGLPLVASTGGAAAETVPDAAALKVAPGDAAALRSALATVMRDHTLRARLAEASWQAGQRLPTWDDTAARVAAALRAAGA